MMNTTPNNTIDDILAKLPPATGTPPVIRFVSGGECLTGTIPPTPWLVGNRIVRGFVNAILAPGGIGKSTLTIADALSVASGKDLLGGKAWVKGNAWIINLEDGVDELNRRLLAAAKHHKLEDPEILNRVKLTSGPDHGQVVMVTGKDPMIVGPMVDEIIRFIKENKIVLVVVDPFDRSHRVNENDNMAIDLVIQAWDEVAKRTGAAVVLVHHCRKASGEEQNGNMDMARGASSFMSAARSAVTLGRMTASEGTRFGLAEGEHVNYLRMDNAKSNMAAPSKSACWFRLVSVSLENGDETYRNGDSRATLEPATLTMGETTGESSLDPEEVKSAALEILAEGVVQTTDFQSQLRNRFGLSKNKKEKIMKLLEQGQIILRKPIPGKGGHVWVGTPEQHKKT